MPYEYKIPPLECQLQAQRRIYRMKAQAVIGDVGSGKTKIGVDFIGNMIYAGKASRAVVICPLTALGVWEQSFEENCPFVRICFLTADSPIPDWNANVILINYDYFAPKKKKKEVRGEKRSYIDWKMVENLIEWAPQIGIIDEGHKVKNPYSRRAKGVHKIAEVCEYKIDFTGTPSGNKNMIDWWSQFRFLKPDLLDDKFKKHKHRYGIWGGFCGFQYFGPKNEREFAKIVAPYVFRIENKDLPPENDIPYRVIMPSKAMDLYREMEEEFVITMEDKNITATIALSKLMKLAEIAGGFIKDNEGKNIAIHTAKLDALSEIVEDMEETGTQRIVIFARFIWELESIAERVKDKWWVHRVSGRVPKEAQKHYDEEGGIMLCQIASGSDANNFQSGNHEIFYSTDDSLINWTQARGRIRRRGQTKPSFYHLLGCKGTVDIHRYHMLQQNKDVAKNILEMIRSIKNDRSRRT